LSPKADRLVLGFEVPVPLEVALDVLELRGLALLDAAQEEGRGAVIPEPKASAAGTKSGAMRSTYVRST
jgi:hypothetical protein